MNTIRRYISLGSVACIGLCMILVTGCKKLVSIPDREERLVPTNGFANDGQAMDAVNGILARCMQTNASFMNGAFSIFPGMSADELQPTANNDVLVQFADNRLTSDNTRISIMYNTAYNLVAQINIVLENLNSGKVTRATRDRLMGECIFFRAFINLQLTCLFGDVPLVTITNVDVIAAMSRTGIDSIYRQVIDDLRTADSLLPASYIVMQKDLVARTHPDKWVAHALLSRIYLYEGHWVEAERMATDVLESSELGLASSPDSVFLNDSREILWQLIPFDDGVVGEADYFLPKSTGAMPAYIIRPTLMNAFEPGDRRKAAWTGLSGGMPYPRKYKALMTDKKRECNVVMRLAEQILIRAEARAEEGDLPGAIADVDVLRSRAGLPALQAGLSSQAVLEAVWNERRIELMCEWGHRWMDLKRTGRAASTLGSLKPAWRLTDALYPLPAGELKKDTNLVQNTGY